MSAVRHGLRALAGERISCEVKYGMGTLVKAGRTCDQILNDNSDWRALQGHGHNVCSFQSMLSNLIANVNPRSLEGLDGDGFLNSLIIKQPALLDTVVQRLVRRTLLETEGWRRIPGLVHFFKAFGLDHRHYELAAYRVPHPNSVGFNKFQARLRIDSNKGLVQSKMAGLRLNVDNNNSDYIVS